MKTVGANAADFANRLVAGAQEAAHLLKSDPVLAATVHVGLHVDWAKRKRSKAQIKRLVARGWRPERIVSFILHWLKSAQAALVQQVVNARLAPVLPPRDDRAATPPPIPPPFIPSKTTIYTNAPNS